MTPITLVLKWSWISGSLTSLTVGKTLEIPAMGMTISRCVMPWSDSSFFTASRASVSGVLSIFTVMMELPLPLGRSKRD